MVETVIAAIVGALLSGAKEGATDVAKKGVSEGYEKLKGLLGAHSGANDEVSTALEQVEAKPDSLARRSVLAEELQDTGADKDAQIIAQANALLEIVRASGDGGSGSQVATGTGIAQADRNSTASVTMTHKT